MRHGIVCALAVALICACQPNAGATPRKAHSELHGGPSSVVPARDLRKASQPMTLRELSKIVGATCENADTGNRCFGGDYDVELRPDCSGHGLLAGVIATDGALLIDKAPPDDSVRRAMLSQGQLVCIQAIARAGATASYYYVIAVRKSDFPKCHAAGECGQFDGRNVKWLVSHGNKTCTETAPGRFEGDCAAGWTDESALEVLANKE